MLAQLAKQQQRMDHIAAHKYLEGGSTVEVERGGGGGGGKWGEEDTTLNNWMEIRKGVETCIRESFQGMSSTRLQKRLSKEMVESP